MNKAPNIQRQPVKMAMIPSTQRQPIVSPAKPPTMGPMVGPKKGAEAKNAHSESTLVRGKDVGNDTTSVGQRRSTKCTSKESQTMSDAMEFAPAAPALKAVRTAYVPKKRICRP